MIVQGWDRGLALVLLYCNDSHPLSLPPPPPSLLRSVDYDHRGPEPRWPEI